METRLALSGEEQSEDPRGSLHKGTHFIAFFPWREVPFMLKKQ